MKTAMVSISEEDYKKLTENVSISRYEYERMRETIELMRDKEALADIVESTEQIKQGKFKTIEQLQKELQLDDEI